MSRKTHEWLNARRGSCSAWIWERGNRAGTSFQANAKAKLCALNAVFRSVLVFHATHTYVAKVEVFVSIRMRSKIRGKLQANNVHSETPRRDLSNSDIVP